MAKKYQITHRVHGINFHREGECNRCGACACEKFGCPHFSWEGDLATCDVVDKYAVCPVCTGNPDGPFYREGKDITHAECGDFPNHPFLRVIKDGVCGYTFKRLNDKEEVSIEPLPFNADPVVK